MEIITLVTIIIGFLGLFLMNLQLNNQIKNETRSQFLELKKDFNDLKKEFNDFKAEIKEEIKIINTRIDVLSSRVDATNARIDRLADAVYSQKAG